MKKPVIKLKPGFPPKAARRSRAKVVIHPEPVIRQMWRARTEQGLGLLPKRGAINPLLDLSDEFRCKLFLFMRDCPYTDAILQMLEENGVTEILPLHLEDFFQFEAQHQWGMRCQRGTQEANALIKMVEKHGVEYSPATLAALQQQVFSLISSGNADPDTIAKMGALFLKVKSHIRVDESHVLRQAKMRRELQGQIDLALEKLSEEVDKHPGTRGTFDALRKELATSLIAEERP